MFRVLKYIDILSHRVILYYTGSENIEYGRISGYINQ